MNERKITCSKDLQDIRKMLNDPKAARFMEWDAVMLELLDDIDQLKETLQLIADTPMSSTDKSAWASEVLVESDPWPREEDEEKELAE